MDTSTTRTTELRGLALTDALLGGRVELADTRCAVLMGGRSSEREVSLVSGRAIAAGLRAPVAGWAGPAQLLEVEIEADGRFAFAGKRAPPLQALLELEALDLWVLGLHGGSGEDGTLQGLFDSLGVAYTGSGVAASATCLDKATTRALARALGLRVPRGFCLTRARMRADEADVERELADLAAPGGLVIKPRRGGSSVATAVLPDARGWQAAVAAVHASGDEALIEERVAGVELTSPVLGLSSGPTHALAPVEIQPASGRFFDYEQKYSSSGARECCPPESVDAATVERVRALGAELHTALGCAGYSRSDWIVPRGARGGFGEPVLLEINTLPGMTPRSLLPQAAAQAGVDFAHLCRFLAGAGLLESRARAARPD